MKGTHLGEFQEIVMLSILILKDNAYGVTIQEEIDHRMGRKISRGALHTALTRLEEKGFISSDYGEPTSERGGRRKRYYEVTNKGLATLQEAKELREGMWDLIPKLT
ncbi:PadR family transcriptional regulator [Ekhidna sp.]|uniref:PadR family transcriptional regulator n=1 Tax=Ekhidna sp. TaxID=2608089 RepID=UPI003C7A3D91